MSGPGVEEAESRAYLAQVMDEIDEEVRRRRATGDLPTRVERELDELFLEYSPVAGRGGGLDEALRMVDAAAYIDPVVPVGSAKSGGAAVKKGLRSMSLWYVGFVTHQVSQFATAVSRSLHLLDEAVGDLGRQLDAQRIPAAGVIEAAWAHGPDAWWVPALTEAVGAVPGRVLHSACGDGWLVRRLAAAGVPAYGVDPRPGAVTRAEFDGTDLRQEGVVEHLRATESGSVGAIVLSGVVDGMTPGERAQLLDLVADRLAAGGTLVVHSLSPSAWSSEQAPPEADLAAGRPLRPATWPVLLAGAGFSSAVRPGPEENDYLVTAVLDPGPSTPR